MILAVAVKILAVAVEVKVKVLALEYEPGEVHKRRVPGLEEESKY
jgi:hypothetical protein